MKITCYGDCSPGCAFMDEKGKCTSDCDNIHDEDNINVGDTNNESWAIQEKQQGNMRRLRSSQMGTKQKYRP